MIKLLIDSASDISLEEADKLGITLLPIEVRFTDKEYMDGVDLLPAQFYEMLKTCKELPKTSQINPFRFEEAFEEATKNGDEVICIVLSSAISGTYSNALQAAEKFKGKVHVIDSLNACIGERLLGMYALNLIKEGLSAEEIVEKLEVSKTKLNVMASIDTLKYLKMGGRISALVAFTGEAFNVKPLIAVVNGKIEMIGKAIGSKKANKLLQEKVANKKVDFDLPFGIVWSGTNDAAAVNFKTETAYMWGETGANVNHYVIGSTIGTHVGPGALGFAFFEK